MLKTKLSCYEISLENLGIRNQGNLIHDGCLKKKKKRNNVRYSRFIFKKEKQIFEYNF